MKLWADGEDGDIGTPLRIKVSEMRGNINRQVRSRAVRAVNVMRTAEKEVLKGQRSGRVYRVPGTYGKATKATRKLAEKYGHKLRGGQLYRASAPGEAPAQRTGALRLHWNGDVEERNTSNGTEVIAILESGEKYAGILESGTNDGTTLKPRPFGNKIKEKAAPEIRKIYSEPYT